MNNLKRKARTAGLMYLIFIIFSVIADQLASFAQATSTQVIERIMRDPALFSVGLVSNVLSGVFFLLAAWALYRLLKDVHKDYAGLFLVLNAAGVVVQCLSVAFLFGGKELINGSISLDTFSYNQLSQLSVLFIKLYQSGFLIAQVFFGLWLLPLGYLVYRSVFLPKLLGILLIIDCAAILMWFFQYFLFPNLTIIANICLMISLIAECSLTLWLLIKGADLKKLNIGTS